MILRSRGERRAHRRWRTRVLVLALGLLPGIARGEPVRASYFYSYMNADHLDSLAHAGFRRAVIKCIQDSLGTRGAAELRGFFARAPGLGMEVLPEWSLQGVSRLAALPTTRRYTWGTTVETNVGCPADSIFWGSALRDRAVEVLSAFPDVRRLHVDLEIYTGSRHHYDGGPCRCPGCLAEFAARPAGASDDLQTFEEDRATTILQGLLAELASLRPGLEIDFFDLDYDSFVHRAMVRALVRTGLPTANYTERSYASGAPAAPASRAPLDSLHLVAPLVCGLQLKNFTPRMLPDSVASVLRAAEGYFVFTSYSLWLAPAQLSGPYVLAGTQADYWTALRAANGLAAATAGPTPGANPGARRLRMLAPWPNPSRRSTHLVFELSTRADVAIDVFDASGRMVRRLEAPELETGRHTLVWDGREASGALAPSGVYLVEITALGERASRRITHVR